MGWLAAPGKAVADRGRGRRIQAGDRSNEAKANECTRDEQETTLQEGEYEGETERL
jgi:hypothetical protein